MEPFTKLTSSIISLPNRNIDTDQIIPARYLKVTNKEGLAEGLFYDWRYDSGGVLDSSFVFNQPEFQSASILLAGDNFGCGSYREHAPWALLAWGIQAIISTSFADIFNNNALKNGLLPVIVDDDSYKVICDLSSETAQIKITIDLENQRVNLPGGTEIKFPLDTFAKQCLLLGVDQLGYIRSFEDEITAYESSRDVFF